MDDKPASPARRKGIYILPNLFTTATLFGGFYAIVMAMNGHFEAACIGILVAMVADGLDGRIARLTGTATDFGKEYDSLCDMVAFGVAPAILVYAFSLRYFADYPWFGGKVGWVIAFTYCACAALRLARFNVLAAIASSNKDFYGVPSPTAAGVVTFFVWSCVDDSKSLFVWVAGRVPFEGTDVLIVAAPLTLLTALSMVTSIRYNSFKKLEGGPVRFLSFAAVVGVILLATLDPPRVLFLAAFGYVLSGPIAALMRRTRKPSAPAPN
ncbi:CDP-diacylglycerol--serine O-phosphatidyltransferase [Panacagrimonas perspica]|uniref:CDP-diacylglycerol--serine O-phosphatidyltransferase n=1 Tax=Panacagrimonas perspica TaxID=381431 RepID=A0A4R7PE77_9GAMM|nr:CDP-diacylglycerol--serine O-phosphatidyltransferase [Panacagrimonas perspica]TDU32407.1 CDP-diacylglycerol--serine O-phosphatidyltransferase [Panacagrimonas perspica]THD05333.1 CDP-diacylglycerol--serine O-phosphatidyltransferase [Panacagrimonas perspica]